MLNFEGRTDMLRFITPIQLLSGSCSTTSACKIFLCNAGMVLSTAIKVYLKPVGRWETIAEWHEHSEKEQILPYMAHWSPALNYWDSKNSAFFPPRFRELGSELRYFVSELEKMWSICEGQMPKNRDLVRGVIKLSGKNKKTEREFTNRH